MNIMISGHRKQKLLNYDCNWIKNAIRGLLVNTEREKGFIKGYSGMASGIDLWFCEICKELNILYVACIPFEEQAQTMEVEDRILRDELIKSASEVQHVRNRFMIETCDAAIIVWDGNKGGTHNCLQQLIENKRDFWWINPVKQTVVKC